MHARPASKPSASAVANSSTPSRGERHLLREAADVIGPVVPIVDPRVADHTHRLARVRAGDRRVRRADLGDALLVALVGARLLRGDEARAHPYALRPERERGREPAPVDECARREHGDVHRVDDLRDQGDAADQAGVPARLGALGDHDAQPACSAAIA